MIEPRSTVATTRPTTPTRILAVATTAFAERGVAGTSLDALATELGMTKQTILYHFGSKEGLIDAVLETAAGELRYALEQAVALSEPGWPRIEATVRAAFNLALRRPELLGLLREVSRIGPPLSDRVIRSLQPLVDQAVDYLRGGAKPPAGIRSSALDPRLVLVSACTMVTGVVTDSEVLRGVGVELDLRAAVGLRRTLLVFLEAALLDQEPAGRKDHL